MWSLLRILLLQVGWKTTREYYTFMWAPLPSDVHGDTAVQQQIQFKGGLGGWVTQGIYVYVYTQAHTQNPMLLPLVSITFRITENL